MHVADRAETARLSAAEADADSRAETALIARCRAGDPTAFDQLTARYRRELFRLAYRVVSDHDDAADIVQEALIRAYRKLHTFRADGCFRNWLYSITVNRALSFRRRRREHVSLEQEEVVLRLPSADPETRPEQVAVATDQLSRLRQALRKLPKRQRAAIVLFGFNDLNLVETAEIMGCAIGTVKSSLHRAREKLLSTMGEGRQGNGMP